jgi:hypothetical protein
MRLRWKLVSVRLEIVLILTHPMVLQDDEAQKSVWRHPIVLLGDEAQVKAYFGLFGDSTNVDTR